jgi:hypothetical protein
MQTSLMTRLGRLLERAIVVPCKIIAFAADHVSRCRSASRRRLASV